MNKHLLLGLLLLASTVVSAEETAAAKPLKIGYVQGEKLMDVQSDSVLDEMKEIFNELKSEIESRIAKWQAENQKHQKEKADLRSEKAKWSSAESREEKLVELAKKEEDLARDQRLIENYQARQAQKIQMTMGNKIKKAVEQFGKKEDYDLVLVGGAFYIGSRVDVTDKVRALLNKEYAATKKKETK